MTDLFCLVVALAVLWLALTSLTRIVGDDFLTQALDTITGGGGTVPFAIVARLFTNNVAPAVTDTVGTYTEATFSGYAPITLSGWSSSTLSGHIASAVSANASYTITASSQVVYGVYFTDSFGTKFFGAVKDPGAPVTLDSSGLNNYVVSPQLQAISG